MTRKIWVLTYEVNDYDQHGEYFLTAFESKPDYQKLATALRGKHGMPDDIMGGIAFLDHILKGGGRKKDEQTWYNLEEVSLL